MPHTFRYDSILQKMETQLNTIGQNILYKIKVMISRSSVAQRWQPGPRLPWAVFLCAVTQYDAIPCNTTDTLPFRPQTAPLREHTLYLYCIHKLTLYSSAEFFYSLIFLDRRLLVLWWLWIFLKMEVGSEFEVIFFQRAPLLCLHSLTHSLTHTANPLQTRITISHATPAAVAKVLWPITTIYHDQPVGSQCETL